MTSLSGDPSWAWNSLDHTSTATLIAGHLPSTDHTRLEPIGHGDFCLAFKLGDRIVRVARHLDAASALRRESCVLQRIGSMLPLPVPRPEYRAPRGCPPFTVHEAIVGEVLTRDDWANMPTVARERAAADLATFLRALHSLPTEIGTKCGLAQLVAAELARKLHESAGDTIQGLLDRKTQRRLDESLEGWSRPSPDEGRRPALLHCDIAPGHLLYDPLSGGLTGVIDFGDIAVGDPARDFIYVYEDYGPAILKEVLVRYAGNDAPSMMAAIRKWYLLEAISWTVDMCLAQRRTDMEHGLFEIRRELAAAAAERRHA